MKTDQQIKAYIRTLDLDMSDRNEACYKALLKVHSFCGISTEFCNEHIGNVACDTVDKMFEVNNG